MNYIKEINSFYDWLELNSVSDSVITLWHALMHINNKAGWNMEFTVAISTLQVKTSLSKSSIIRARNVLKQLGRIDFRERKGNQSCAYKILAFHSDTQNESQPDTEFVTQADTQTVTQTDTINKLNYTKLNNVLLEKEPKGKSLKNEFSEEDDFDSRRGYRYHEDLKAWKQGELEPVNLEFYEERKRKKVAEKKEKEISEELFFVESVKPAKESSKKVAQKKVSEKFIPPSVQLVQEYCNERKNGISAYTFVNFYQSKGWLVGKSKMKDWKAAVRTWEQKNEENGKSNNQTGAAGKNFSTGKTNSQRATYNIQEAAERIAGDFANGNIPGVY